MTRNALALKRGSLLTVSLILMSIVLGTIILSTESPGNSIKFNLGGHVFHIPEKNSLEKGVPEWLRWLPGLDNSSNKVLIIFPAHEVSTAVDGYETDDGKYVEDVRGLLTVLNEDESRRYEDPGQYEDLWKGFGSYEDRIVEKHKDGLYKVFRKSEYPYSWALLKQNPEVDRQTPDDVSDFWIAHCLDGESSVAASGTHTTCKTRVIRDDLLIEFNVSEQNISLIDEIGDFLVSEVTSWQVK